MVVGQTRMGRAAASGRSAAWRHPRGGFVGLALCSGCFSRWELRLIIAGSELEKNAEKGRSEAQYHGAGKNWYSASFQVLPQWRGKGVHESGRSRNSRTSYATKVGPVPSSRNWSSVSADRICCRAAAENSASPRGRDAEHHPGLRMTRNVLVHHRLGKNHLSRTESRNSAPGRQRELSPHKAGNLEQQAFHGLQGGRSTNEKRAGMLVR